MLERRRTLINNKFVKINSKINQYYHIITSFATNNTHRRRSPVFQDETYCITFLFNFFQKDKLASRQSQMNICFQCFINRKVEMINAVKRNKSFVKRISQSHINNNSKRK